MVVIGSSVYVHPRGGSRPSSASPTAEPDPASSSLAAEAAAVTPSTVSASPGPGGPASAPSPAAPAAPLLASLVAAAEAARRASPADDLPAAHDRSSPVPRPSPSRATRRARAAGERAAAGWIAHRPPPQSPDLVVDGAVDGVVCRAKKPRRRKDESDDDDDDDGDNEVIVVEEVRSAGVVVPPPAAAYRYPQYHRPPPPPPPPPGYMMYYHPHRPPPPGYVYSGYRNGHAQHQWVPHPPPPPPPAWWLDERARREGSSEEARDDRATAARSYDPASGPTLPGAAVTVTRSWDSEGATCANAQRRAPADDWNAWPAPKDAPVVAVPVPGGFREHELDFSRMRCIPLELQEVTRLSEEAEDAAKKGVAKLSAEGEARPLAPFVRLVNFPEHLNRLNRHSAKSSSAERDLVPEDKRHCTMCGLLCFYGGHQEAREKRVPQQNKGMCNACDARVWLCRAPAADCDGPYASRFDYPVAIKWCKGCKNFRRWPSEFREKPRVRKCMKCRARQRRFYVAVRQAAVTEGRVLQGRIQLRKAPKPLKDNGGVSEPERSQIGGPWVGPRTEQEKDDDSELLVSVGEDTFLI